MLAGCDAPRRPTSTVEVVVLGTAQDGGLPHVGCHEAPCERARHDPSFRRLVVSLGIVDRTAHRRFLVEATPDLPEELDRLDAFAGGARPRGRNPVDGVLLTHGHVGHYTGLVHFGREVASTKSLPLYGTDRMLAFLRGAGPWSLLFELHQLEGRTLRPDRPTSLTRRLRVTPVVVPHRDEFTDTVGLRFEGPSKKLLFVPDIDKWERWERHIEDEVARVDVALLDATFHSPAELPGRSLDEIPHPMVTETVARLARLAKRKRIVFIHMNHSNPICDSESDEARAVRAAGFEIAKEGDSFGL